MYSAPSAQLYVKVHVDSILVYSPATLILFVSVVYTTCVSWCSGLRSMHSMFVGFLSLALVRGWGRSVDGWLGLVVRWRSPTQHLAGNAIRSH